MTVHTYIIVVHSNMVVNRSLIRHCFKTGSDLAKGVHTGDHDSGIQL